MKLHEYRKKADIPFSSPYKPTSSAPAHLVPFDYEKMDDEHRQRHLPFGALPSTPAVERSRTRPAEEQPNILGRLLQR